MVNNSKSTGSFTYDLVVALALGKVKSGNPEVEYFLNRLPDPDEIIKYQIEKYKDRYSKLSSKEIKLIFKKYLIYSFKIDCQLFESVRSYKEILEVGNHSLLLKEVSKRTKEIHWYLFVFPKLFMCINKLIKIASSHPQPYIKVTQPISIIYYLMWCDDSQVKQSFSNIKDILNLDVQEQVMVAVENDKDVIKKKFPENKYPDLDEAKKIKIEDYYDEEIKKIFDKQFINYSTPEIVDEMWNKNNDINYLPKRIRQIAVKKLTTRDNVRRQKDRKKNEGISEEEIKKWERQEMSQIYKFHDKIPIINSSEKNNENGMPEEYIPSDYNDPEVLVAYIETEKEIKKILIDSKEKLFSNSPTGKDLVDYIINNLNCDTLVFTNRKIAEIIGCNEDTVGRLRHKLNDHYPMLKELLT